MEAFEKIVRAMPWYGWLGLVAIVGGIITGLVTSSQRHQERLEKIRQGIDSDAHGPPGKD